MLSLPDSYQKGYAEKHQRRGRTPKLSIEDLLLATLEYLREYRIYSELLNCKHPEIWEYAVSEAQLDFY